MRNQRLHELRIYRHRKRRAAKARPQPPRRPARMRGDSRIRASRAHENAYIASLIRNLGWY